MTDSGIFKAAVSLPAHERAAYLERACGNNEALRQEIESLLRAHDAPGSFPERLIERVAVTEINDPITGRAGTVIGPYKLLEQIGEGGMGVVYMAEQVSPVRRRVALKIIKPGMDTRQVIARFEAERQALALMDHPNIAKVLDAGATDSGRPYFVMELVRGVQVTEYCDKNNLSVQERLELFIPICQAVQHAHQKGIIHRDLKPTNVLVTLHDGTPVPKVIDFGVAKAMNQQLTDKTLFTSFAQMVGTPLYMSPEQAEMSGLDVDTRSDIYSLGVLLYELLTGTTPFDSKRLNKAAIDEIRRIIREEEPPKPSTRLSTLGDTRTTIAAHRRIDPGRLNQLIRGDLDWIVMKSLEKDRTRRYETANGLARDVQRYLADQPVEACPPSAVYRFRKFARRNRVALTSIAFIALALVGGIVTSTWLAVRARQAEAVAQSARDQEAKEREAAEHAREEAQRQRAAAEANLQKARAAVDKYFTLVSESTLLDVPGLQPLRGKLLEAALEFYQGRMNETTNDPAALADLAAAYMRFAEINHVNDRNDDAIVAVGKGLDLIGRLRREFPQAREQARKLAGFWKGYRRDFVATEKPKDPQAAFRVINEAAETWKALAEEYPDDPAFRSDLAAILYHIGELLASGGQTSEGIKYFGRGLEVQDRLARDYPKLLEYRADLARLLEQMGRNLSFVGKKGEGESYARKALAVREEIVAERPDVPQHQVELANSLGLLAENLIGRDDRQAEALLRREAELSERLATQQYHVSAYLRRWSSAQGKLLCVLTVRAKTKEAEALIRGATEFIQRFARLHRDAPWPQSYLANIYDSCARTLNAGDQLYPARIAFWKQAIALHEGSMADPAYPADDLEQLGHAYRWVGGRENYARAADVFARLSATHPGKSKYYQAFEFDSLTQVVHALLAESKFEQAEPYLKRAVAIHGTAPQIHLARARILAGQNKREEARAEIRAAVRGATLDFEGYHSAVDLLNSLGEKQQTLAVMSEFVAAAPKSPYAHWWLGAVLSQQGRHEDAVAEFRKSVEAAPGWEWSRLALAEELLVLNKRDEALAETRAIVLEPNKGWHPRNWLGNLWWKQGHPEEAVKYLLQAALTEPEGTVAFDGLRNLIDQRAGKPDQKTLIATTDQALAKTRYYADWCTMCGRWREAATEFEKRIASNPNDHYPRYQAAFVLAIAGDLKKYRSHCADMLARFRDTNDPYIAERIAKACLILEGPDQLPKLRELAERSVILGAQLEVIRYFQFVRALADYRAGQYASSHEWLQKCLRSDKGMGDAVLGMVKVLSAMTERRLGNEDKARSAWAEARQFCADRPDVDHGRLLVPGEWHDSIGLELLFREAQKLFDRPTTAESKPPANEQKAQANRGAQLRK
ncbi:MAG TPA: protein kinase [Planctomycetaceae bacterium]|nr:protein kinase [Planctomycetaceae bacterium]